LQSKLLSALGAIAGRVELLVDICSIISDCSRFEKSAGRVNERKTLPAKPVPGQRHWKIKKRDGSVPRSATAFGRCARPKSQKVMTLGFSGGGTAIRSTSPKAARVQGFNRRAERDPVAAIEPRGENGRLDSVYCGESLFNSRNFIAVRRPPCKKTLVFHLGTPVTTSSGVSATLRRSSSCRNLSPVQMFIMRPPSDVVV